MNTTPLTLWSTQRAPARRHAAPCAAAMVILAIATIATSAGAQTRVIPAQPAASQPAGHGANLPRASGGAAAATPPAALGPVGVQAQPAGIQPGRAAPPRASAAAASGRPEPMPDPRVDARVELVNEAVESQAPLTREEIVLLRRKLAERDAALNENVSGKAPPRPTGQVYQLNLSPDAESAPPLVRVTPGQGAVVSFHDAAGQPWPIAVLDNANGDGGVIVKTFTEHQATVFVKNRSVMGNVLVALKGLPTAVAFTVMAGQDVTDYQVRMMVPRFVNGAPPNLVTQTSIPAVGTADLFDFMLRTPPQTAKPLKVEGLPGVLAWQTGAGTMVVRTEAALTTALRSLSLDGVNVYEVQLSPALMATLAGRYVTLRVSGF